MDDTPRSLLCRLAADPSADDWRRLDALYRPFVAGWLHRAGVPPADADDLGQDVLAVVVREVPAFRQPDHPGAFRAWLRAVLVNRARGYWRTRATRPPATSDPAILDALEDPASGLSGEWDREHEAHVARRLLAELEGEFSPTTWVAFRRQVVDGLNAAAVAAELGTSPNAVLLAKSRVLRRLRQEAAGLLDG